MWIRYKFRSAVSFDVVDIGDRPAISVGELKAKIVAHKHIKLCHDFDLVFLDHLSGKEYNDENYQIPSNSSVIIKRVPAGSVPSPLPFDSTENLVMKKSNVLQEKGEEMHDFEDFGIDLCPVPEKLFQYTDLECKRKNICDTEKANIVVPRLGEQKLQDDDLVEVIPKGSDHYGTKGKLPPEMLEPKVLEHGKLGKKAIDPYDLAEKYACLPSELRCFICTKYLKEAVMIPCCQHSFCERCIREVLSEKSKCPKCSSDKFKAEDLLPNLSLRNAIVRFLENQIQFSISETVLRRYVPDEESCIQANDISTAMPIFQKKQNNIPYPSASKKGSNRLLGESFHGESLIKRKIHHACPPSKIGYHPGFADCQGENYPLNLPQNHAQEKGEDRKVSATAIYKKGDKTCYMCDSPEHFIRDCPFADRPHPLLQTGNPMYAVWATPAFETPYWNAFGPMRPFTNIYANHGMMPYNAYMFPVSPVGASPYMASMYGPMPAHRRQPSDDDDIQTGRRNLPKSSQGYFFHAERENSGSYSGDKHTQRSRGNDPRAEHFDRNADSLHERHGKNSRSSTGTRDRKAYHAKRSNSGEEYMSKRSDRYGDERHKHRHHKITRNHYERRGHFGSGEETSFCGDHRKRRREEDHQSKRRVDKHTQRSRGNDPRAEKFDRNADSLHERHGKNSRSSTGTRDRKAYHAKRSNSGAEYMSKRSDRYGDERHKRRHHKITRNHYERRGHFGSGEETSFSGDHRKRRREEDHQSKRKRVR